MKNYIYITSRGSSYAMLPCNFVCSTTYGGDISVLSVTSHRYCLPFPYFWATNNHDIYSVASWTKCCIPDEILHLPENTSSWCFTDDDFAHISNISTNLNLNPTIIIIIIIVVVVGGLMSHSYEYYITGILKLTVLDVKQSRRNSPWWSLSWLCWARCYAVSLPWLQRKSGKLSVILQTIKYVATFGLICSCLSALPCHRTWSHFNARLNNSS